MLAVEQSPLPFFDIFPREALYDLSPLTVRKLSTFSPLNADLTLGCSLYDPQCYSFDINIPFLIKEYTAKVMPLR